MDMEKDSGKVGYSERITDTAYQLPEAKEGGLKYLLLAVPALAVVFLWRSGLLTTWLFAVLIIVTVLLALLPILRAQRKAIDKTYDGVIASIERREPVTRANVYRVDESTRGRMILYTIRILDCENRMHTYERMGGVGEDYTVYYKKGDVVRHHHGFDLPEKHDKSGDATIVCIACGHVNSMDSQRCTACSTTLLW